MTLTARQWGAAWQLVSDGFLRTRDGRYDLVRTPDRIGGEEVWLVIDGDYGRTFRGLVTDCLAWAKSQMPGAA